MAGELEQLRPYLEEFRTALLDLAMMRGMDSALGFFQPLFVLPAGVRSTTAKCAVRVRRHPIRAVERRDSVLRRSCALECACPARVRSWASASRGPYGSRALRA